MSASATRDCVKALLFLRTIETSAMLKPVRDLASSENRRSDSQHLSLEAQTDDLIYTLVFIVRLRGNTQSLLSFLFATIPHTL